MEPPGQPGSLHLDVPGRRQGRGGDPEAPLKIPGAALALVAGLVLGAGGVLVVENAVTNARLDAQRAELVQLKKDLDDRRAALDAGQAQLNAQAAALRAEASRALAETDAVVQVQGSVVDRLRQLAATIRRLKTALEAH